MLPKHNVSVFILLAATFIIGAIAIIIPATRTSAWILASLLLALASPLPVFLGRRAAINSGCYDEEASCPPIEIGYFVAAWFVTSAIVWPIFVAQLGWVAGWRTVLWAPIGVLVLLASMLCYNAVFNREDDNDQVYIY